MLVLAVFVVGGAVAFPVTILILATGAVFGPWLGLFYSATGAVASALAMYFVGSRFGQEALGRLLGRRWKHMLDRVRYRGLLTVVALRALPVAPFTLVNLAAGASAIRLADFILGTLIGMVPGLVAMAVLGDRLTSLLAHPSVGNVALLVLCVALWVGLSFGVQALLFRAGEGRIMTSGLKGSVVRLMTWNIHGALGGNPRFDPDHVVRLVQRHAPDIVALQEINSRRAPEAHVGDPFDILQEGLGLHGVRAKAVTTADGDYGQALISRWPMLDTEIHDLSYETREPRRAICSTVRTPAGPIRVIATHLGLSFRERHSQALTLLKMLGTLRHHHSGDG